MRRLGRLRSVGAVSALVAAGVSAEAQEVTLPLDSYLALRSRAEQPPPRASRPAVPVASESADLALRVSGRSAHVRLRLALWVFDEGWQSVPLPAMGSITAVDFGTWSGRVAGQGPPALLVRGAGRQVVTIDSVVEVAEDVVSGQAVRTLRLALPLAATINGTLVAPEGTDEVVFASGAAGSRGTAPRTWTFAGERAGTLEARMMGPAPVDERSRRPLRFDAVSAFVVRPSRTRRTAEAWIGARVAQGRLDRLRVRVPAGFEVLAVDGAPLSGWEVSGGVLEVRPAVPATEALALTLRLAGEAQTSFEAPLLVPEGAARSRLISAVALPPDAHLEVADARSARSAEPEDLEDVPEAFHPAGARVLVVEDPRQPAALAVEWPAQADVLSAQVDRLLVDVVVGEGGRAAYQFWASIRNAGLTEFTIEPPPGFETTGAHRDGIAVTPGRSERGLVFPIHVGEQAQTIHIAGLVPLDLPLESDAFAVPLPVFSDTIGRIEVRLVAPGGRIYSIVDATLAGRVEPPPDVIALEPTGTMRLILPRAARRAVLDLPGLFEVPPGYVVSRAAWSALTARPRPLTLKVRERSSRREWF